MEQAFLDWLSRRLPDSPSAPWGIADDTALVRLSGGELLVTTDLISDEVDFRLTEVDPRRVGHKALAVNLSDMAAMAATPVAAVISLLLPRDGVECHGDATRTPKRLDALEIAQLLYEGIFPLAEEYHVAIAGGDVNCWSYPLAINVTVLGEPGRGGPLRRNGAKPGDWILVTGELGGSILGHHLDFEPRVNQAKLLHDNYPLHAGMDISDGLALDVWRLAQASGCGAVVNLESVPISTAARKLASMVHAKQSALEHALGDGEDFELLLAAAPSVAQQILRDQPLSGLQLTHIGCFVEEGGLWSEAAGKRQPLPPTGYLHGVP